MATVDALQGPVMDRLNTELHPQVNAGCQFGQERQGRRGETVRARADAEGVEREAVQYLRVELPLRRGGGQRAGECLDIGHETPGTVPFSGEGDADADLVLHGVRLSREKRSGPVGGTKRAAA